MDAKASRRAVWLVVGLVAVGAAIRFGTLDLQSYHHDEAVTVDVLDRSFGDMLGQVARGERSPPLYYVLAWGWAKVFGTGEVGLRSLSALFGVLMIPAACWAARNLAGVRAGVAAAALVALNPLFIDYSQEARSYMLMCLLVLLAIGSLARWPSDGNRWLWWWAGGSALGLATHYFAVFLVAPQIVWVLWRTRSRDELRAVGPIAAILLVGLALLPLALHQQGDDRRDGFATTPVLERAATVSVEYGSGAEPDLLAGSRTVDVIQIGGALVLAAGLLMAIGSDSGSRRRSTVWPLCGLVALSVGVPILLALAGLDLLNPRNLIASLIPVVLAIAVTLGATRTRTCGAALSLVLAASACVSAAGLASAQMQRIDWRSAAEAMGPADGPRLIVIPKNGDDPLEYYLAAKKFEGKRFDDGVQVREVLLLSTRYEVGRPSGFRLVEERGLAPSFFLRRYEAKDPRLVTPAGSGDLLSERSEVLIDR